MSYSQKGNTLTSWATKKQYTFTRTPDGGGKRLAIAQLEADDRAVRDAAEARAGRPLSARELIALSVEKPKAQAKVFNQPVDDGKTNHFERALADIRNMPERTRDQRTLKKKMLAALEQGALAKQSEIEAAEARDARLADPLAQKAIEHGQARLDSMMTDPKFTQDDIVYARARLEALKEQVGNGTENAVQAYWDAAKEHSNAILDRLKARQKEQREQLELLSDAVKRGEVELLPPEPTTTEAPTSAIQAAMQSAEQQGIVQGPTT